MEVKITSVYDEGAIEGTQFIGAKGFAVLIEADGKKILFDTGRRGRYLLNNLMFLDVKPEEIDKVVISHGHTSHTGGVDDLLRNRGDALFIYAPRSAFERKNLIGQKGIHIPKDQAGKADIVEIKDWMEIADKVFISCPLEIGKGLAESFIVLLSKKGPIVISACSHAGVGEVMEAVKERFGKYPCGYIGGTHIRKREKKKAEALAEMFAERNCNMLYLNHCTGVNGILYIRTVLGLKEVNDFYVGSSLSVDL